MIKRVALLLLVVSTPAVAERANQRDTAAKEPMIRAIPQEEVAGLLTGQGAGLAKPAELNGYPGPAHVLELADKLKLSREQRETAQRLFDQAKAEAAKLGAEIVQKEAAIEGLFQSGKAADTALWALLEDVGRLWARLRFVHLRHHIAMRAALTPEQVTRYGELRGYAAPSDAAQPKASPRHQ